MSLEMHNLKPSKGSRTKPKRLGRGNASGKGTTAGRGTKGQSARAGGRNRRQLRGLRQIMLSTPKLRGFKSLRKKPACVRLSSVDRSFIDGENVTPDSLKKKGLISDTRYGAKIVGGGKLTKKLHVSGCKVTSSVRQDVEKIGGKVE